MSQKGDQGISLPEGDFSIRQRLIQGALDCFKTYGYHGTTLARILEKAGVTRGMWSNHYTEKIDLVIDAFTHFLNVGLKRSREVAREIASKPFDRSELLIGVWENFSRGLNRDVWVEFNVACRTDKALLQRINDDIRTFFKEMDKMWQPHLALVARPGVTAQSVINMSLYLLRSISLKSMSLDVPEQNRKARDQWLDMITRLIKR